jgi:hypothetical protein
MLLVQVGALALCGEVHTLRACISPLCTLRSCSDSSTSYSSISSTTALAAAFAIAAALALAA